MEQPLLLGGNMTDVVRVGDTVRRTAGPWTPTIHALLRHVHAQGFTSAPSPLGYDEAGRESLSLLPGAVATYPLPNHALSDATLKMVGTMLRSLHDATATFDPSDNACWQLPAHEPREVICHNDFAPYNSMFEAGRLTGIIDFDTSSPGPRVWDMAYTAYRFIPLTSPDNPDVGYTNPNEQLRRLDHFLKAYGIPTITPDDVITTAIQRLRELAQFIDDSAAAGDPTQMAVLARGDTAIYNHDIEHLQDLRTHRRRRANTASPKAITSDEN